MTLTLATSDDQARRAYELLDRARKRAKTVVVPRALFAGLVIDHGRLLAAAQPRVTILRAAPSKAGAPPASCAANQERAPA